MNKRKSEKKNRRRNSIKHTSSSSSSSRVQTRKEQRQQERLTQKYNKKRVKGRKPHIKLQHKKGKKDHWHTNKHPRLASVAPLTDRSYTVVQEPGSLDALIPLTGTMTTDALLS